MSGLFSSVVKFSVSECLRRAEKLSVLQTIKSEAESDPRFPFRFPRHHKQPKLARKLTSTQSIPTFLSTYEIEQTIRCAFADAYDLVAPLGVNILDNNGNPVTLDKVSDVVKMHLEKTATIRYSSQQQELSDSSSESHSDLSTCTSEPIEMILNSDEDQESQEESDPECLSNVDNCTFRDMRVYDNIKPSLAQSYFKVAINGQTKFLHKQTACWLLTNEKLPLSSDRVTRVKVKK